MAKSMQQEIARSETDMNKQRTAIRILGVSGSLRENSHSTRTLATLLEIAANRCGADVHLMNLRETKLPFYNPSITVTDLFYGNIKTVSQAVNWADAFVLASPDYHGSMSGTIKNFLDHFWQEFAGKTFGYLCTSHEKGLTVMDQMRTAVRQCYGWSMPYGVSINSGQDFNTRGEIINSELSKRLNMLARDLVVYGKLIRDQFKKDLEGHDLDTYAARYR
ncbi:MAG: NADPH-dependent FMN reductase [Nitrososphaeraceae archaeon]